jgi:hypothetical protein
MVEHAARSAPEPVSAAPVMFTIAVVATTVPVAKIAVFERSPAMRSAAGVVV